MSAPLENNAQLKPPASVVKIAEFLGDVRGRQTMGDKFDVAEVWDKHDISVTHIDGFLNWLHVDRTDAPPKELVLTKEPEKTLNKKPPREEEDPLGAGRTSSGEAADEPAINIHLWNALFKPESKRRRREMPQAASLPLANRAGHFANGYNGNLLLTQLVQAQANPDTPYVAHRPDMSYPEKPSQPGQTGGEDPENVPLTPVYLTNGLAAKAFGNQIASRADGMQPMWNEPFRRDLLPTFGAPDLKFKEQSGTQIDGEQVPLADPLYGQITLVAPPLQVSPEMGQGAAMGLSFDWRDMARGAGLVDYPGLVTLAKTLPEGSKVLYPAMDPRQLRGGAVNLRLDPRLAEGLVGMGYGASAKVDAWKSARMAADWHGGTPPIRLLPATMTPLNRPSRRGAGMSPDNLPQGGAVRPAEDASRRMRFIDFLGLPIYLSPNLNTTPDLEQESRARISAEFMPRAPLISPLAFANLRSQLLGGFYGVEAKPELGAWRRAAPDYEKAGSSLSGLLSNRLRMGAMGDGLASPSAPIPKSAALPSLGPMSRPMGPSMLPTLAGAAAGARAPLRPSAFVPPSMPSPAIGSPPQGEVPKFIRHQPKAAGVPATAFKPTIPAAPQAMTAPRGQGLTAPQGAEGMSPVRVSPQITVSPEKMTSKAKSTPAKQSQPSGTPASQPAPMEGPKPARSAMIPQAPMQRPSAPPSQTKSKPSEQKAPLQTPSHDAPKPTSSLRPPQMLVAPPKGVSGGKGESEPLAIQTATESPSGGSSAESGASRSAEVGEKKDTGLPGSEINLLANEVWILLKRRLAFEAQRMGR